MFWAKKSNLNISNNKLKYLKLSYPLSSPPNKIERILVVKGYWTKGFAVLNDISNVYTTCKISLKCLCLNINI